MSTVVPLKPRTRKPADLLQLRIELAEIKPAIWRRIVVPESITLARLHHVIQCVMGWHGGHLHEFEIAGERYGIPDPEFDWGDPPRSEQRIQLKTALAGMKSFKYLYDFGDHWEHRIKVEKRHPPDPILSASALCLTGANAAPPEDVGGAPGYADFLEAILDPDHPNTTPCGRGAGRTSSPGTLICLR
jgi:hypothetical protein